MSNYKTVVFGFQYSSYTANDKDPVVLVTEFNEDGVCGINLNYLNDRLTEITLSIWNDMYRNDGSIFHKGFNQALLRNTNGDDYEKITACIRQYKYAKMHNMIISNDVPIYNTGTTSV